MKNEDEYMESLKRTRNLFLLILGLILFFWTPIIYLLTH